MSKHIIFMESGRVGLAPTDEKKDAWVTRYPNATVKTCSDEEYTKSCWVTPTLSGDTVSWETMNDSDPISDASEAQNLLNITRNGLIDNIKAKCWSEYDNDEDAKTLVSFLEGIDVTSVSSIPSSNVLKFIYEMAGCPQIFIEELIH